jgi:hypothetical protein
MKTIYKVLLPALCAAFASCVSAAEMDVYQYSLSPTFTKVARKAAGRTPLFWQGERHPRVAKVLEKNYETHRRGGIPSETIGGDPISDPIASSNPQDNAKRECNRALYADLKILLKRARRLRADGIINITSFYEDKDYPSSSQFACYVNNTRAGVMLRADFVKFEK